MPLGTWIYNRTYDPAATPLETPVETNAETNAAGSRISLQVANLKTG